MLPTYARNKNNTYYSSLGASGAVSAVLFAYILFAPWNTLYFICRPYPFLRLYLRLLMWLIVFGLTAEMAEISTTQHIFLVQSLA